MAAKKPAPKRPQETELYPPIKALLQGQGYEVKAEIGDCDVTAIRGEEDPVIVELKTGFSLSLFHQAIARQSVTDWVYIAVPRGAGKPFAKAVKNNATLCRRLGLGLITVRLKDGFVEIHTDPLPYRPRKSKRRTQRLLAEFAKRVGDPNKGGSTRVGLMTAYRQDALKCVKTLADNGPTKAATVSKLADVKTARRLMADNHYGWFERIEIGIYALSPKGENAVADYAGELARLVKSTDET